MPDRLAWVAGVTPIAQNKPIASCPAVVGWDRRQQGAVVPGLGSLQPGLVPKHCSTCLVRGVDVCLAVAVGCVFWPLRVLSAALRCVREGAVGRVLGIVSPTPGRRSADGASGVELAAQTGLLSGVWVSDEPPTPTPMWPPALPP